MKLIATKNKKIKLKKKNEVEIKELTKMKMNWVVENGNSVEERQKGFTRKGLGIRSYLTSVFGVQILQLALVFIIFSYLFMFILF